MDVIAKENLTGVLLALVSSGFIGASFIIKKKGLKKAAATSGVRAGVGGYSYLSEPLWWFGMITRSVVVVIHAPEEHPINSVLQLWNMATQPGFLFYVASVIVLVFILVFLYAPQYGNSNVLVFTGICSLMGSLSVMSVKALGTALKLTFEGKNQLLYSETWFFTFVVAICVITQMNYLNKALDTFNTAIVSPIYYVMFTSLTILASVIMFKDWADQNAGNVISEICGFIVVLSGTILLHTTKDFERSSSFKGGYASSINSGGYAPLSPTLATRLYNGSSEFTTHDEEDAMLADQISLQRQG
ncbi:unnamed protein product [Linum tenue]|uniref:Probable magnesium transporter n=1 Tax=Linum tenue TaxID=586396 RepID=A0AAV0QU12_9ROSI|nr:unnamed protein product [Linum tenue]